MGLPPFAKRTELNWGCTTTKTMAPRRIPSPTSRDVADGFLNDFPMSRGDSPEQHPLLFVDSFLSSTQHDEEYDDDCCSSSTATGKKSFLLCETLKRCCGYTRAVVHLLWDLVMLALTVIILSPGFVRFAWYYWMVAKHEMVQYAHHSCRQRLDVYPVQQQHDNHNNKKNDNETEGNESSSSSVPKKLAPVVVFVPGGGWIVGYKLWGALLARSLTSVGQCAIVMLDYRNFPLATVPEQLEDVEAGLLWTKQHIHEYGGDAKQIVLVGESAGGHLASLILLKRALLEERQQREEGSAAVTCSGDNNNSNELCSEDIKGFVSIAAPYDLGVSMTTFLQHGMNKDFVHKMFGPDLLEYDPVYLIQQHIRFHQGSILKLPPMKICHGTRDKTVPYSGALNFVNVLAQAGVQDVEFRSYDGWNHTQGNVEGPMVGDYRFHQDVWEMVQRISETAKVDDDDNNNKVADDNKAWEALGTLCPRVLVKIGSYLMPV